MKPGILAAAGLCLTGAALVAAAAGHELHVLRWWLLGLGFITVFAAVAWHDLSASEQHDQEPPDTDWRWPDR